MFSGWMLRMEDSHGDCPRMGSDYCRRSGLFVRAQFQSTLPVWGATLAVPQSRNPVQISIHAPRMGSDSRKTGAPMRRTDFNPHSPHGERHRNYAKVGYYTDISIHAPRMGSDSLAWRRTKTLLYFNPRSPCGERLHLLVELNTQYPFQSTLPMRGATVYRARH